MMLAYDKCQPCLLHFTGESCHPELGFHKPLPVASLLIPPGELEVAGRQV
jgi:hypothetical protein